MNKNNFAVPGAIVLAGILIAAAIIFGNYRANMAATPAPSLGVIGGDITMNPVTSSDHIMGKLGSKVTIVEYGDLECPYCKQYEPVLNQIISTYGTSSGEVAWVYRAFPIHSKAPYEAEAAECAADQGGSDTFFKFIN